MTEITIEATSKGFKAYKTDDPSLYAPGKSESEALAGFLNYSIGKLVLKNPEVFHFSIRWLGASIARSPDKS